MNAGGVGSAGVRIDTVHTVVLFRPSDGKVIHLHQSVVLEGGRMITREDAERRAVESARRMGHDVESLSTLYLDRPAPPGQLAVDLNRNELVSAQSPPGLASARRPSRR
jgi:hypothetical protein